MFKSVKVQPSLVSIKPFSTSARSFFSARFHLNSSNLDSTTVNFYNYSVKDIRGKWVHLHDFKGKLTLVSICNTSNPDYPSFVRELQEVKSKFAHKGFEVLIIPRYPVKTMQDTKTSPLKKFLTEDIETNKDEIFVCKGVPQDYDKLIEGSSAYDTLTINAECGDAYRYLSNFKEGSSKTIVEDFEKFLIDKDGHVVFRCGNNTPLEDVIPHVEKELELSK